jgi:hypothetical protein
MTAKGSESRLDRTQRVGNVLEGVETAQIFGYTCKEEHGNGLLRLEMEELLSLPRGRRFGPLFARGTAHLNNAAKSKQD